MTLQEVKKWKQEKRQEIHWDLESNTCKWKVVNLEKELLGRVGMVIVGTSRVCWDQEAGRGLARGAGFSF